MRECLVPERPIVILDDDRSVLDSYNGALRVAGYDHLTLCEDSRRMLDVVADHGASVVLLDLVMPHVSGETLLEELHQRFPDIPVIVITGKDTVETAVKCMKMGAFDFLVKPVSPQRLLATIRQALSLLELRAENQALRGELLSRRFPRREPFEGILTNNAAMLSLFKYVQAIGPSSQPVLITGETGVGKEMFAQAVHKSSGRLGKFVPVNVAGLEENVFSDTLFGHKRGAYTGADTARPGLAEEAAGGTLFLDEIGDLATVSQVKLLRLLEGGEYRALGSDRIQHCDARLVLATNRDLEALCDSEVFRRDLYYRLRTHRIHVPTLRERLDDLPLLAEAFFIAAAKDLNRPLSRRLDEILPALYPYSFPGNVRELKTLIFDIVSRPDDQPISLDALLPPIAPPSGPVSSSEHASWNPTQKLDFGVVLPTIEEAKDLLIGEALMRTGGNKSLAAAMLGITRQALGQRTRLKGAPKD